MRTAWTPRVLPASSLAGEAVASDRTGQDSLEVGRVTVDQFPTVILSAAGLPPATTQKAAYIAMRQRCFAPT